MSTLRGDESGCFKPDTHLQICRDCRRNIVDMRTREGHRLWTDFKVEVIDTSQMTPGSLKVVCIGYWEKK